MIKKGNNFYTIVIVQILLFIIIGCNAENLGITLNHKWSSDKVFKVPESVNYDNERDLLYISNISGNSSGKDGNGFISQLKLTGEINNLKWITGLNAPKGGSIYEDKFYVSDIDELIEIDIVKGKIINKYQIQDAIFLNDVATDDSGNVYISDMSSKNSAIYKFTNGSISKWIEGEEISSPNGLCISNNKLFVGNSGDGKIKSIDLNTKEIKEIAEIGSGIDGLKIDSKGNIFISDWQGRTSVVKKSGEIETLLNTVKEKINSADIELIQKKNLLIIPTFFDNRIVCYEIK